MLTEAPSNPVQRDQRDVLVAAFAGGVVSPMHVYSAGTTVPARLVRPPAALKIKMTHSTAAIRAVALGLCDGEGWPRSQALGCTTGQRKPHEPVIFRRRP
jgi:hypothetical protein